MRVTSISRRSIETLATTRQRRISGYWRSASNRRNSRNKRHSNSNDCNSNRAKVNGSSRIATNSSRAGQEEDRTSSLIHCREIPRSRTINRRLEASIRIRRTGPILAAMIKRRKRLNQRPKRRGNSGSSPRLVKGKTSSGSETILVQMGFPKTKPGSCSTL